MNIPGRHGVIKMVSSFPTAATTCTVYPPLTALRMHLGNFPQCLTRRTSMLALADDAALARLVIVAAQRRAKSTASKLSYRAVEGMPVRPRT